MTGQGRLLIALLASICIHLAGSGMALGPSITAWTGIAVYLGLRLVTEGYRVVVLILGIMSFGGYAIELLGLASSIAVEGPDRFLPAVWELVSSSDVGGTALIGAILSLSSSDGLSWSRFFAWIFVFLLAHRVPARLPDDLNAYAKFNLSLKGSLMMALTAALSVSAVLDAVGFPGGLIRLSLVVVAGLASAGLGRVVS